MGRGERRADGSIPSAAARGRARRFVNRLENAYPEISTVLEHRDSWQLLVATVISAQTTDENVNRVLPELFARYPSPSDLASASEDDVERIIYSTGFYRQKTRSIVGLSAAIMDRFGGQVPDETDDLVSLPGVGRKTANVVLAEAFGRAAIAVDTHVRRVVQRWELTKETDPDRIEQDLRGLIPKRSWNKLTMRLIQHGRDTCDARRPRCWDCFVSDLCPYPDKNLTP
ncbi:MAG: endonuclease III [Acidimicrobiia bacterium]